MGKFADAIKKFLTDFLNKTIKSDKDFFSKSKALIMLQVTALALITPLLVKLKEMLEKKLSKNLNKSDDLLLSSIIDTKNITDDDVIKYVKNNKDLQKFLKYASSDSNESIVSDIVLACNNPNYYDRETEQLKQLISKTKGGVNGNEFINVALKQSDFESKTNDADLSGLNDLLSTMSGVLPWVFMVYLILLKVKEFLTQNEHPSPYRGKYLQRLIRLVTSVLKQELKATNNVSKESKEGFNEIKSQISAMISSLSSLDAIIVASLMASFIYINNRKQYQKESTDAFLEYAGPTVCNLKIENAKTDEETSLQNDGITGSFSNLVACPIEKDDVAVPHEPLELKMSIDRLTTCDIEELPQELTTITSQTSYDTAAKACFENISSKKFSILVKKDQQVTSKTVLGVLGSDKIYSPVNGIVLSTKKNIVCLSDVGDPESSYLENLIQQTQDLYKEMNDTKFFLKDFYINSWLPIMLNDSPLVDSSISATELGKIQFFVGGITARFDSVKTDYTNAKDSYEHNISIIAGKDNVKTKAENNQLGLIKNEIESEDTKFYSRLKTIAARGELESNITMPTDSEFILSDYYFQLYQSVLLNYDQNDVIKPFRDKLNDILINRYFIEGWDENRLKNKINSMCNTLSAGTFFNATPDFFLIMLSLYDTKKNLNQVKSYVTNLSKNNKDYTSEEKTNIINRIMYVFDLVISIRQKISIKFAPSQNKYKALITEASYIQSYFSTKWKRYNSIPKEIEKAYKQMDDVGKTTTTYTIVKINNEDYRYYSFGNTRTCPLPPDENGDDYLNPFSKYNFGDIEYWLKYCGIATLVGITNPFGWSTGLPPPIGPTPFPVVYIPIKAFQLNWGFIVIGLSVCGIYPFPWVLFANLSTGFHVPLADPASAINANIKALKKSLSGQLKTFKQKTLKDYMKKTKGEIDQLAIEIDNLLDRKRLNRENKPKKDRTKDEDSFLVELSKWDLEQASLDEQILTKRTDKFVLESKYKIVYVAFSGGKMQDAPDPKIKSIKKTEEQNDKLLAKLEAMFNSIDPLVSPLPAATQPVTANFGLTIKNPKPIIKIDEDLNDNVNNAILKPIIEKFKLKNESFMESNFTNKSNNSFTNVKMYKEALKVAMLLLITKDPFPKYENLKLTNVPYMAFLYTKWTPVGAKTYGFPGFTPLPV